MWEAVKNPIGPLEEIQRPITEDSVLWTVRHAFHKSGFHGRVTKIKPKLKQSHTNSLLKFAISLVVEKAPRGCKWLGTGVTYQQDIDPKHTARKTIENSCVTVHLHLTCLKLCGNQVYMYSQCRSSLTRVRESHVMSEADLHHKNIFLPQSHIR